MTTNDPSRPCKGPTAAGPLASPLPASRPAARGGGIALPERSSREREFAFTNADFERIRTLIHAHAGIALSEAKQDMVYSRLSRRLRACGDLTFAEYLARVGCDRGEWEAFVNSLTTNLTSFFREPHHFEILAARLRAITEKRTVHIWCNASSTGEEPYSLAITACEAFDTMAPPVRILASDIDTGVLAQARQGVYRAARLERVSAERRQRYFVREPGEPEAFRVRPELQRLVSFHRINLLEPAWPVHGPLDAIFCRNVMIYFDKATQYALLRRFVPLLRRDGALFAGHSESFLHATDLFRSLGRTVYQRADADVV